MKISDIRIGVIVDSAAAVAGLAQIERTVDSSAARMNARVQTLKGVGTGLSLALTTPLLATGGAALSSAVSFERLKAQMDSVTGSSAETARQLRELREVAKLPGIGFEQAVAASQQLEAAGLNFSKAETYIKSFGQAAGSIQDFTGAMFQIQQMVSTGKATWQDMRILEQHIPQVGRAMREAFNGQSLAELSKSGMSATQVLDAISSRLKEVRGNVGNDVDNAMDKLKMTGIELGKTLLPTLQKTLEYMNKIAEAATRHPNTAMSMGIALAAVGPGLNMAANIAQIGATRHLGGIRKSGAGTIPESRLAGYTEELFDDAGYFIGGGEPIYESYNPPGRRRSGAAGRFSRFANWATEEDIGTSAADAAKSAWRSVREAGTGVASRLRSAGDAFRDAGSVTGGLRSGLTSLLSPTVLLTAAFIAAAASIAFLIKHVNDTYANTRKEVRSGQSDYFHYANRGLYSKYQGMTDEQLQAARMDLNRRIDSETADAKAQQKNIGWWKYGSQIAVSTQEQDLQNADLYRSRRALLDKVMAERKGSSDVTSGESEALKKLREENSKKEAQSARELVALRLQAAGDEYASRIWMVRAERDNKLADLQELKKQGIDVTNQVLAAQLDAQGKIRDIRKQQHDEQLRNAEELKRKNLEAAKEVREAQLAATNGMLDVSSANARMSGNDTLGSYLSGRYSNISNLLGNLKAIQDAVADDQANGRKTDRSAQVAGAWASYASANFENDRNYREAIEDQRNAEKDAAASITNTRKKLNHDVFGAELDSINGNADQQIRALERKRAHGINVENQIAQVAINAELQRQELSEKRYARDLEVWAKQMEAYGQLNPMLSSQMQAYTTFVRAEKEISDLKRQGYDTSLLEGAARKRYADELLEAQYGKASEIESRMQANRRRQLDEIREALGGSKVTDTSNLWMEAQAGGRRVRLDTEAYMNAPYSEAEITAAAMDNKAELQRHSELLAQIVSAVERLSQASI